MKTIAQSAEFGCGPACLAMLADISLDKALEVCGEQDWEREGISEKDLRAAFAKRGYAMGEGIKISEDRHTLLKISDDALLWGPILERDWDKRRLHPWNGVTERARFTFKAPLLQSIVRVSDESTKISIETYDHWAVWDGKMQVVRDPYGYLSPFAPAYYYPVSRS